VSVSDGDVFTDCDPWILTDDAGRILDWHPGALGLLGYTDRSVKGRSLPVAFNRDRPGDNLFQRVVLGHPVEREGEIRPRDRRPVRVQYRIELAEEATDARPILRWCFHRL
jgi:PAS domain S-box-containing protein